jgi:hypothetical protein
MARQVPITITVSGGAQGAAEVNRLSSSFNGLNTATNQASSGGLRNSFNATNLMRSEVQSLASQIPIVGRFFNGLTSDALRYAQAGAQVTQQLKQQRAAYDEFIKLVANQSQSKSPLGGGIIPILGDLRVNANTLTSETNRRAAFSQYLKEFQAIEDPAKRAQIAIDQFGAKGAQLLPILESMSAAEVETATSTAAVGTSFAAIAGPAAIALAVVVALAAGFALAVKGGVELVNLATTQASKFQDLSDKTNFQVETLQGLNVGAIKAGGNIEKLSAGLGIFDKNITQAYESDTKLAKQFKDFNIDVSNNEVALRQVLAALAAMPPGAKQTELAMLAFGKSGKDVVGVLKNLDGTLDEQIEKLRQMGFIMSKEDVKAAADFGDKIDLLKLKIIAMGARIGLELIPYAERLIDKFDALANEAGPNVARWANETIEHARNVGTALKALADISPAGAGTEDSPGLIWKIIYNSPVGTGLHALAQTFELLDKIGAKLRGPQATAPQGIDPQVAALMQQASNSVDESARIARGQFTSTEQERINGALKGRLDLLASIKAKTAELGDATGLVAVKTQLLNMKLEEQPGAYKALEPIIKSRGEALNLQILAAQADYVEKQKQVKAADEAAKATENFTNETAALQQRLVDLSGTQSKARTEIEKFNEALAGGKFKNIEQANLTARRDVLRQIDDVTERMATDQRIEKYKQLRQEVANSLQSIRENVDAAGVAALPDRDQRALEQNRVLEQTAQKIESISHLKIDREKFAGIVDLFKSAPEAIDFGKAIADVNTILQNVAGDLGPEKLAATRQAIIDLLTDATKTDRDLYTAQTALGQSQREYNALLAEQGDLTDPVLQQQILQNELLKNKIDLQLRDRDAVIATDKAQLELADKATYHAAQANAQVAEFMARTASVTEIVASAKTGVIQTTFDYLDAGLAKANSHLGRMGGLLTQIEGDFIKLAATKFFQWLFGIGGGTSSGGGGGGFLGGIFGGGGPGGTPTFAGGAATLGGGASSGQSLSRQFLNFIRGGGGGTAQYASTAPFFGSLSALTNEGISVPQSLSGANPFLSLRGGGTAVDTNLLSAIGGGGGAKAGLGASLLQFAPLLGLGAGAAAGSRFEIGGQIGGGAIGLGAALGIGNLFGSTALSTVAATLGLSLTAVTAGLFGIGAAVLVASILIKKNAEKRKNETARAALNNDTYTAIIQILNNARSGQYSSAGGALADFDKVKSDYFSKISGYDSKTKKIATDVWNDTRNGFEYYRPLIKQAAEAADVAKTRSSKLVPEFRDAGAVWPQIQAMQHLRFADSGFIGRVPGLYDRQDDKLIRVSGDEVVLAPKHWKPITKYLQAVRVPGFADSGAVSRSTAAPPVTDGGGDIVFHASSDAHAALLEAVLEGMTSPDGRKIIIKTSAGARRTGQL